MRIVRSTQVAVGLSAVFFLTPTPTKAQEAGFIEDSSLTLNTRQWYSHEIARKANYYNAQTADGVRKVHDRTAWLQGFKLDYVSGFTQGMIGFGLDLSLYSAVSLERSKLATAGGSNRLLADKDGNVVDDWTKAGVAALKFKVADTVVKVGRHQVKTPVMNYSDTRTLPASYDGASLESHDIEGLTIKSGYFNKGTPRTGAGSQDLSPTFGSRLVTSDWIAYAGATTWPRAAGAPAPMFHVLRISGTANTWVWAGNSTETRSPPTCSLTSTTRSPVVAKWPAKSLSKPMA